MTTIPHRELRNQSSKILERVKNGETIDVTNNGEIAATLISTVAVIARAGSRLAFTAAFQPACRTALVSAAATSVASIPVSRADDETGSPHSAQAWSFGCER